MKGLTVESSGCELGVGDCRTAWKVELGLTGGGWVATSPERGGEALG